jgi:hypothetical protein
MKHHIKIIFFFIFCLYGLQLFAGAWTQKKNGYYLRIYSSYLFAKKEFNFQGNSQALYEENLGYKDSYFKDISLVVYSEFGLTNYFTFIGELPFKSLTIEKDHCFLLWRR